MRGGGVRPHSDPEKDIAKFLIVAASQKGHVFLCSQVFVNGKRCHYTRNTSLINTIMSFPLRPHTKCINSVFMTWPYSGFLLNFTLPALSNSQSFLTGRRIFSWRSATEKHQGSLRREETSAVHHRATQSKTHSFLRAVRSGAS